VWLRWVLVAAVALMLVAGAAGGDAAGSLIVAGLVAALVGVIGWLRRGLPLLWVPGRRVAAAVGGIGVAGLIGGAVWGGHAASSPSAGPPLASSARPPLSAPAASSSPAPSRPGAGRPSATNSRANPRPSASRTSPPLVAGSALAAVPLLAVNGRAPMTRYSRAQFGPQWADVDRNGCDTRNDILRLDLDPVTVQAGTRGCVVASGILADPYTGRNIAFQRGITTSSAVQIDHVVALGDAWQTGAQTWTAVRRQAFANDPLNLLAVDGPANEQKGDGDTATWLPANKAFRCPYVARQVSVKRKYALSVTAAERDAMTRVLTSCPHQPLTSEAEARTPKAATATTSAPRRRPPP
jgi:hypothetical protein